MSVDLSKSSVDRVKHMHVGGDMKILWTMFDHVKCPKDWTTLACHVYNSMYCKVLTIVYYDMHSEDGATQTLFWKT